MWCVVFPLCISLFPSNDAQALSGSLHSGVLPLAHNADTDSAPGSSSSSNILNKPEHILSFVKQALEPAITGLRIVPQEEVQYEDNDSDDEEPGNLAGAHRPWTARQPRLPSIFCWPPPKQTRGYRHAMLQFSTPYFHR
ncbi:hypothetical protein BV22DRAFT_836343 [Leucogyrophana mollusca]|uniref:Uncharacterized protein n=1 Tax=Leucogyrophana mollusca TaxID=85980 RepID=A0ACB8B3U5_9AGAM|nr:hypothetical protein BV22DRAFT_836343 [Leucogyrophana mollusca]